MVNTDMASEEKHLLVSDSNEVSPHFDSRKLGMADLAKMAWNDLLKNKMGMMSKYMFQQHFINLREILDARLEQCENILESASVSSTRKFKAVDG